MYIGQYKHTIDPKNRLFIPAVFRGKIKSFILTQGLEGCLFLYDPDGWQKVLSKLDDLSLPDKMQERAFKRALLSGAYQITPDFQGRILIPKSLKEFAGIKIDAVILGVGTRVEIWDQKKWNSYYKQRADSSFKTLAGKLEI
jgi:MraZ protein